MHKNGWIDREQQVLFSEALGVGKSSSRICMVPHDGYEDTQVLSHPF